MTLATFLNQYLLGSSISHLDRDTYVNTADFLMVPAAIPGQTLDSIIAKHPSKYGVIGPGLLAILQTIGWPTKESPNPIHVALSKGDIFVPNGEPLISTNRHAEVMLYGPFGGDGGSVPVSNYYYY